MYSKENLKMEVAKVSCPTLAPHLPPQSPPLIKSSFIFSDIVSSHCPHSMHPRKISEFTILSHWKSLWINFVTNLNYFIFFLFLCFLHWVYSQIRLEIQIFLLGSITSTMFTLQNLNLRFYHFSIFSLGLYIKILLLLYHICAGFIN